MRELWYITVWMSLYRSISSVNICDNVTDMALSLCENLFPQRVYGRSSFSYPTNIPGYNCSYTLDFGVLIINRNLTSNSTCSCNRIPPSTIHNGSVDILIIENSNVVQLVKNSFSTWFAVTILGINMNRYLKEIEPGAFDNLTNVFNLTISDNPGLGPLREDTFRGLINLRELRYLRNNLKELSSVTVALSPLVLPNVTVLYFTGNNITRIERDDFKPMVNSSLNTLAISLTNTEWIDSQAFDPLGPLVNLILTRNNLNSTVLTPLVHRLVKNDKTLNYLSLGENLLSYCIKSLLKAVAQEGGNVTYLSLESNHLGILTPGYFPKMSDLKHLDLTNVMLDDLPEGVITSELMPKLEHLQLGSNMFPRIKSSMVTKTLIMLDISNNNNYLQWNSYFEIEEDIFSKMPSLLMLDLSSNNLNILRKETFSNARALKILLLRKTSLNKVEEGAFINNYNLFYLDLSGNIFPIMNPFTKDIFKGLYSLIALDLSNCHISHIVNNDVFSYLGNLKYLSLRMNSITHFSSTIFDYVPNLIIIDLRYNILSSWTQSIFTNNKQLDQALLDYNHLLTITHAMLNDFMSTKLVQLYGNTIVCDCNLMNTVSSMFPDADTDNLSFSDKMNTCAFEQGSKPLSDFLRTIGSSQCLNTMWVTIVSVTLASLTLFVLAVYIIYYYFKYDIHFFWLRMKRRLGLLHYIRSKKNPTNNQKFKYDAFVSYSIEDEKFVEKMVYILENNCSSFKLCVFERDFKVGDVLPDRILESMECSRRTIIVLTAAFARSQWCCWEMYIAQNRSISLSSPDPDDPLVLIMKSDIPESLMTPTLRYLMKTRVYLKWHANPVRQKIFWQQLIQALTPKRVQTDSSS